MLCSPDPIRVLLAAPDDIQPGEAHARAREFHAALGQPRTHGVTRRRRHTVAKARSVCGPRDRVVVTLPVWELPTRDRVVVTLPVWELPTRDRSLVPHLGPSCGSSVGRLAGAWQPTCGWARVPLLSLR